MLINYCSLVYAYLAGIASKSLVLILVARSLGVNAFGQLSFAISYVSLFLVVADMGLRNFTTTEVARSENEKDSILQHAGRVIPAKLMLSLGTFLLLIGVAFAMGYDAQTITVIIFMAVSYLLISFVQLVRAFFGGKEMMHYEALIASVEGTTLIAVIAVCTLLDVGLLPLVAAWSGAMILTAFLTLSIFYWRIGRPQLTVRPNTLAMVKQSFFFGLGPHMAVLYMNLDTVFIKSILSDSHAGLYQAAFRLVFTSVFLASNFMRFLYPMVTKMHVASQSGLQTLLTIYHKIAFASCAPVLFFFILYSEQTIKLIYGSGYDGAGAVLQLLSAGFIISYLPPSWTIFPAIGQARTAFFVNALGAVVNCILNAILIPRYGMLAGAWASVVTYGVVKILIAICFHRLRLPVAGDLPAYLTLAAWCIATGYACSYYLSGYNLILVSAIYSAIYAPVAFVLLWKDMLAIRNLRQRIKATD